MLKSIVVLCSLLLIAPSTLAAKITTTEDLVQAMQKKYAKSWYKTAAFVQRLRTSIKTAIRKLRCGMRRCLDGKVVTTEEYSELRANVALDSKLFDPQSFAIVHCRE